MKGNESIYVDTKYKDENINPFLESLWTLIPNSGNQSEQEEKLQEQLATFFGSTKEIVKVLITLSGKLLTPSGLSNYVQAFLTKPQDTNNNPNLDYIKQLIKALSRDCFLIRNYSLPQQKLIVLTVIPPAMVLRISIKPLLIISEIFIHSSKSSEPLAMTMMLLSIMLNLLMKTHQNQFKFKFKL